MREVLGRYLLQFDTVLVADAPKDEVWDDWVDRMTDDLACSIYGSGERSGLVHFVQSRYLRRSDRWEQIGGHLLLTGRLPDTPLDLYPRRRRG